MQRQREETRSPREESRISPLLPGRLPERILAAQNRLLHAILDRDGEEDLLALTIEHLQSLTPDVSFSAHLLSPGSDRLSHGVSKTLPEALVREMEREPLALSVDTSDNDWLREIATEHGVPPPSLHPILSESEGWLGCVMVFADGLLTPDLDAAIRAAAALLGTGLRRARAEHFALAANGAKDGLWHWDMESGEIVVSSRWCRLLGLAETNERKSTEEWLRLVHPEDRDRVETELKAALEGRTPVFESTHRMVHADGHRLWVLARGALVRGGTGAAPQLAGSLTDVTQQKLDEERLRLDDLTGLPNRSMLMNHLRRLLERARRSSRGFRFAVLFLDLDRFKRVNDSLGHLAGDQLLVAIGRRLRDCVRPGDVVARLGGDEFAIVLEPIGEVREATRLAARIHNVLREPFELQGFEIFITTSIGIAIGSGAYERPSDVLRDADTAMYRAKAAGKARHEIFDPAMNRSAAEQLRLEAELRRATEREEFRLRYQPIVSLEDRAIRGFEALARWKHPSRGLLPPAAFLAAAEETGLILDIGFWVLREACRQASRWQAADRPDGPDCNLPLSMHVNLSDKQLFQPDLVDRIESVLIETGLSAPALVLDVSESVVMQKAESSVATLGQLKSLGVRIHLDDFGTGYSSLRYLHRFEIDTLKVDRSFVRHLRTGGDNWIAVRTIVGLAKSLGMDVIAEGVETEEQLSELLALGCELGQGSLFHSPLSPEEAEDLVS